MNKIFTAVEKFIGPKLAAVASAATVAVGQITSALGVGGDLSIMDVITNAAQSDLISFLPAPIAGILGYFLRSTDKPVEEAPDSKPIDQKLREERLDKIHSDLSILADKFESLDDTTLQIDEDVSSIQVTVEHLIHRVEKLEGVTSSMEPLPLNLRQNNPGNIESTIAGKDKWVGEKFSGNRYAVFETPAHGVRAMMYLLRRVYYTRHNLLNVQDIIHRWAPLGDNSPESVDNYVRTVAKALGVTAIVTLNLDNDDDRLVAMMKAMSEFEGGRPLPYSSEVYTKALELLK